jgi:DNA-binding HxlR family transcriptional regulator
MRSVRDAIDIIEGKWKLPILIALSGGSKRFGQLTRHVEGISDKMLSKELKDLELNRLVSREASEDLQAGVEYSITDHGRSLEKVMRELYAWGLEHRRMIIGD